MQLTVPADLESLINKRLASGAYADVEDVLRQALEIQDADECQTDEDRHVWAHIEEGYRQAERGELIDGDQAKREMEVMKEQWRASRR